MRHSEGHLAHFILDIAGVLDLAAFHEAYSDGPGRRAYSPKMMVAVWLYAFMQGIRSSR